jgi:MFS superfamily sulfate permease-like transporter
MAPQFRSIFLLSIFYLTNFELVSYIPKTAFSSLICLSFLDMVITWGYDSYFKTKEKMEWLVVPLMLSLRSSLKMLEACKLLLYMSNKHMSTFIYSIKNLLY